VKKKTLPSGSWKRAVCPGDPDNEGKKPRWAIGRRKKADPPERQGEKRVLGS